MRQSGWMSLCKALGQGLGLSVALMAAGRAETPPDAGSLRRQIEQQQRGIDALPPVHPAPSVAHEPAPAPAGPTVQIKAIGFEGATLLSQAQLSQAVQGYIGRALAYADLQRVADTVAEAYMQAGWLARVYLPEQDLSNGRLTLQVVEAQFSGVRLEGAAPSRIAPEELQAYFRAQQDEGQPLNTARLDRALLLADDLPGVSVAGALEPGLLDGETTLVLQTTDEPLLYGDVSLDNNGARSTGRERLSVNLNANSPTGRGELLSMNLLRTARSDYVRLSLTVPVGHDGWRVGANISSLNYEVLDSPAHGRSSSVGLDWSYPLVRARRHNLYYSGGLDQKRFVNVLTQVQSDYASQALRMGLAGNWFDDWAGGGANSASVQMLAGQLVDMKAHTALTTIDHHYRKLSYSLSRQQNLSGAHSLYIGLAGQYANQNLDSSERLFIGGPSNVRAYPVSEIGGDKGQTLSAEWRWRLDSAWLLTTFVDLGRVQSLAPRINPGDGEPLSLRGRGLSLSWLGPRGLSLKATWSQRNGSNPKPTSAGTDSDGTLQINRLWLNASLSF